MKRRKTIHFQRFTEHFFSCTLSESKTIANKSSICYSVLVTQPKWDFFREKQRKNWNVFWNVIDKRTLFTYFLISCLCLKISGYLGVTQLEKHRICCFWEQPQLSRGVCLHPSNMYLLKKGKNGIGWERTAWYDWDYIRILQFRFNCVVVFPFFKISELFSWMKMNAFCSISWKRV